MRTMPRGSTVSTEAECGGAAGDVGGMEADGGGG